MKQLSELSGWLGVILCNAATLPTIFSLAMGWTNTYPPLSMVLMIWAGLLCLSFRSIVIFDMLYLISSLLGFFANSVLLLLIASA